jgi:hypothetical protein
MKMYSLAIIPFNLLTGWVILGFPDPTHGEKEQRYVRGFIIAASAYLIAANLWQCVLSVPAGYRRSDFRQFYAGAYLLHTGKAGRLYDFGAQKEVETRLISHEAEKYDLPFVSPAYHALLLSPLAAMSYGKAYAVFFATNCALLCVCFALLRPWTSKLRSIYPSLQITPIAAFLPVGYALMFGQDSILLTSLFVAAFLLLGRQMDSAAGAVLALGLFKFQIVIPIVLLFAIWKRWRFLAGFIPAATILCILSVWLVGPTQTKLYVASLFFIAKLKATAFGMAEHPVQWPLMPNIAGFCFGSFNSLLPKWVIESITVVVSFLVLVFTARRGRRIHESQGLLLVALPAAILTGYHTYMHDLTPLFLPLIVVLDAYLLREGNNRLDRFIVWTSLAMFIAPAIEQFFPNYTYLGALVVLIFLVAVSIATMTEPRAKLYLSESI